MSGYVASARVRGNPRLVHADRGADPMVSAVAVPVEPMIVEADADRDPDPFPAAAGLVERARAFRERLSQLTFYLLDPNSWR